MIGRKVRSCIQRQPHRFSNCDVIWIINKFSHRGYQQKFQKCLSPTVDSRKYSTSLRHRSSVLLLTNLMILFLLIVINWILFEKLVEEERKILKLLFIFCVFCNHWDRKVFEVMFGGIDNFLGELKLVCKFEAEEKD